MSLLQSPCQSTVEVRQTLDEPRGRRWRTKTFPVSLILEEHDERGGYEEDDDYLPGVLDSGVEYKFKRVLAEGWVNKKGTGNDWMGSRALKARWARLVVRSSTFACTEILVLLPQYLLYDYSHCQSSHYR